MRVPALIAPPGLGRGRDAPALCVVALTGTHFLDAVAMRRRPDGQYHAPNPSPGAVELNDGEDLFGRIVCHDADRDSALPTAVRMTTAQLARFAAAADAAHAPEVLGLVLIAAAADAIWEQRMPSGDAGRFARTLVAAHCATSAATRDLAAVVAAAWRRARDETIGVGRWAVHDRHDAQAPLEVTSTAEAATAWVATFVESSLEPAAVRAFYARAYALSDVMMPPGVRQMMQLIAQDPRTPAAAADVAAWGASLRSAATQLPTKWRKVVCEGLAQACGGADVARRVACVRAACAQPVCRLQAALAALAGGRGAGPTVLVAAGTSRVVLAARVCFDSDTRLAASRACHLLLALRPSLGEEEIVHGFESFDVLVSTAVPEGGEAPGACSTGRLAVVCRADATVVPWRLMRTMIVRGTRWVRGLPRGAWGRDFDPTEYSPKTSLVLDWSEPRQVAAVGPTRGAWDIYEEKEESALAIVRIESDDFECN